jgi:hypothetical protein
MVQNIAARPAPEHFGVEGCYLLGSTKNCFAGPCSDVDLLIHFEGSDPRREALLLWLDGWSRCLNEMKFLHTGYRTGGLLDVHLVTDKDIRCKTSYAVKIGATTNSARELPMGQLL